jgi:2-hydroxy-3-keto-5-methylthiopentenyl-1-phosphate phosphatase
MPLLVQLDFDGTVTEEDVSFLLLDEYAGSGWRRYLEEYSAGKISVAVFSKTVFGMIKADEKTMTDFVLNSPRVRVRPGFKEFLYYCSNESIKVVVVSNGLRFYIEAILREMGITGLEVHAAECEFSPEGGKLRYIGPDGVEVDTGFKEAFADRFHAQGYRIIYVGDGASDIYPSRKASFVCATATLYQRSREENLPCQAFRDFYDITRIIEGLELD